MKNILLTTTAMIAFAGAAAADGHASISWSGTATAGVAREGGSAATPQATAALIAILMDGNSLLTETTAKAILDAGGVTYLNAINETLFNELNITNPNATTALPADIATTRKNLATALALVNSDFSIGAPAAEIKAAKALIAATSATMDAVFGTLAVDTGEWDTYAEVNLTATGSVDLGNGVTVSGAVSVDGGTGYDFADDDGFDSAKTNGVALDYVKVDGGAMGALTFDKNDIAHLVDGDDDETGDIKYTNAFGNATVAFVMDMSTDSDTAARKAYWKLQAAADKADDETTTIIGAAVDATNAPLDLVYGAAIAADVQWSVKLGYTVSDSMSVYAAFDEGQGNAFGGSYSMNGMTVSVDSKLEALEAEIGADRSNTIAGSYSVAGFTAGASYNTIEDGNQWGVNAAYAVDGMSVAYSTNEGEEWEATASYALNDLASVNAAVNYTEDAYVGVSFKF